MWKQQGQQLVYSLINPLIQFLVRQRISPNAITIAGLAINFLAAIIFIIGAEFGERNDHSYIALAGLTILIAGLFDMIDGRLAREGNMASSFGALFDSVLDRYSELVMFLGICYYLVAHDYFMSSIFAFIAMIGSIMVSYTRARAEGLGVNCSVGMMQRPERIIIVSLSAIACGTFSYFFGGDFKIIIGQFPIPIFEPISLFTVPIFILAIWSNHTALKRLNHARKELEKQ